ncbi:MAG: thiol:disulfide interchange protein DsbA/DsbL [Woeseiaceae bacterium]|nr:thiol:disulfide interchange protein DsbA/DsbL [Woeseiaceae bacterium]
MKTIVAARLLPILALAALSACGREDSAADTESVAEDAVEAPAPSADYRFTEGEHFLRFDSPQPTVGDDGRIEVSEVFWYGCHHCANLEAPLNAWVAEAPDTVRFERIPATWNQTAIAHAQIFYTIELLSSNGAIDDYHAVHAGVFEAIHKRGIRLLRLEEIEAFFADFGVDSATFNDTWNSAEVAESLRVANELARSYRIEAVPTLVIGGQYKTTTALARNELFSVVDELIEREEAAL